MAEITKVTTPLVPQENLGNRNKPVSDQAFDLTDPSKVHRTGAEHGKIMDHADGQASLWDSVSREMLTPVLKNVNELLHAFQKMTALVQMGVSTTDILASEEVRELLDSIFLDPEQMTREILEQDKSAVLFKGAAFDLLRDILIKFPENMRVQNAVSHLLKTFEQNVNAENSIKTILLACNNLLDYLFSGDRAQFSQYLEGLSEMLLPEVPQEAEVDAEEMIDQPLAKSEIAIEDDQPVPPQQQREAQAAEKQQPQQGNAAPRHTLGVEQREAAQVLKGNLLPLLGEVVVKYNQNERIRDIVMVVVHNIVRVDQGTPENLQDAIAKLVSELQLVATLPPKFEEQLLNLMTRSGEDIKNANDTVMDKLSSVISEVLSNNSTNAATIRQAETLLLSLLQNQSSAMNVLHFFLPMETEQGRMFAEMYVDPDCGEKVGRSQEKSRKIFLAFETDTLGAFELCFLESAERVDFSMWCPELLVGGLGAMKKQISNIMQLHGYTMNSYNVAELREPHSIAEVFPRLLERRMGVDVRI